MGNFGNFGTSFSREKIGAFDFGKTKKNLLYCSFYILTIKSKPFYMFKEQLH